MYEVRESKQGQTVDALALGGDEGRDKLRKARGRRKLPLIPGYPNGATRQAEGLPSRKGGERGELKHLSTLRKRNQPRLR